jgi:hypothetical protein
MVMKLSVIVLVPTLVVLVALLLSPLFSSHP